MKLLVVEYSRERGSDDREQAAEFERDAEQIAGVPGLLWKLWAYDDDEHTATSVHLFDNELHARAWGDGPLIPALTSHEGIADVKTRYLDVDEHLSELTRAPLAAVERA
jgi:hypothetical protein